MIICYIVFYCVVAVTASKGTCELQFTISGETKLGGKLFMECLKVDCGQAEIIIFEKTEVTSTTDWTPVYDSRQGALDTKSAHNSDYTLKLRGELSNSYDPPRLTLSITDVIIQDYGSWRCTATIGEKQVESASRNINILEACEPQLAIIGNASVDSTVYIDCITLHCDKADKIQFEKTRLTSTTDWTPVYDNDKGALDTGEHFKYTLKFRCKHTNASEPPRTTLIINNVIPQDQGSWRCVATKDGAQYLSESKDIPNIETCRLEALLQLNMNITGLTSTLAGEDIDVSCETGYWFASTHDLVGTIMCTYNGIWSTHDTCEAILCDPPVVGNASESTWSNSGAVHTLHTHRTFECNAHYYFDDNTQNRASTCTYHPSRSTAEYSPILENCTVRCSNASLLPANAYTANLRFLYQEYEEMTLMCDSEYNIENGETVTGYRSQTAICTGNGEWRYSIRSGDMQFSKPYECADSAKVIFPDKHDTLEIFPNDTFTLTCKGTGYGYRITWHKDGNPIINNHQYVIQGCESNQTKDCTSTLTSIKIQDESHCQDVFNYIGVYTCVAQSDFPFKTRDESVGTTLHISNEPVVIGTPENTISSRCSNEVVLRCDICTRNPETDKWYHNGEEIHEKYVNDKKDGKINSSLVAFGQYQRKVTTKEGEQVTCNVQSIEGKFELCVWEIVVINAVPVVPIGTLGVVLAFAKALSHYWKKLSKPG